jgi:hypothetical protein
MRFDALISMAWSSSCAHAVRRSLATRAPVTAAPPTSRGVQADNAVKPTSEVSATASKRFLASERGMFMKGSPVR